MTLLDVLNKDLIKVPLTSCDRRSVIEELVDVYRKNSGISGTDAGEIVNAVLNREAQASTAMENGIAIPHAKLGSIKSSVVVIGISRLPVDFGGQEGSKIFFLVLAPEDNPTEHIQILSSIAKVCSSPVYARLLANAKSSDDVYQLFFD